MENKNCVKCGDLGELVKITIDDGEFSNTLGEIFCDDCYNSLMECITEMIYGDEEN